MSRLGRSIVSLLFWALSLPGLAMHVAMLWGALPRLPRAVHELPYHTLGDWAEAGMACLFAASILSWPIFAWMTFGWIFNRPIRPLWTWVGTVLAVAWMLPFPMMMIAAVWILPGILFATYVCMWHRHPRVRDPFAEDEPSS